VNREGHYVNILYVGKYTTSANTYYANSDLKCMCIAVCVFVNLA